MDGVSVLDRLTVTPAVAFSYAALALGVLMLAIALRPARKVVQELAPGRLRAGWILMIGMICVFIAGYLAEIVLSLQRPYGPSLLVAVVFVLGAWFVLLVCRLARVTVRHVTRLGVFEVENLTDALMGPNSRQYFERHLHQEVVRGKRYNAPLSVLMLEIDQFEQIVKSYGEAGGDRALRALGATLRRNIRAPDLVARHGGARIVLMLPYTGLASARVMADRVRATAARVEIPTSDAEGETTTLRVTVSGGLATLTEDQHGFPDLVGRATAALERALAEGRDRLVADERDGPPMRVDQAGAGRIGPSREPQ